jgi:hypothetical protein
MSTRMSRASTSGAAPAPWFSQLLILLAGAGMAALALYAPAGAFGAVALVLLVLLILIYPTIGIGSILVIAPTYLVVGRIFPKNAPVTFLLILLTYVGIALRRVHERRAAPFRWTPVDIAAAFLMVNALLYIPLAANLKTGVYGYHELLRLFLLYFAVRLLAPAPEVSGRLLWAAGITGFLIVLYGCIQPFWHYEWVMIEFDLVESLKEYAGFNYGKLARAHSILVSPLTLGYMGMVGALSAVGILAVSPRRDAAAVVAPLLLVASIGASVFSYTRSSWLGIAAALFAALMTVFRGRDRLMILVTPLVAGIIAMRFVPALAERVGSYALTIVSDDPRDTSLHYVALVVAAKYFWSHKLGVGLGAASFSGFTHGGGVQVWSENTFLQMGIQTGFQGMLGLIVFSSPPAPWPASRRRGTGWRTS